ncbi:MAG: ATP-binding protein [Syntrophobacteraceae bacterium]
MREVFVPTMSYQKCLSVKEEQLGQKVAPGISVFMGRSGRGKTTAALKLAAMDRQVCYVSYAGWHSPSGILREACFAVAGARPRAAQACFDLLERGLSDNQRMIMVDESDRMSLKHLNVLRDLHDRCCVPVILIGEEPLRGKLAQERRLISRISHEVLFEEVVPSDIAMFYTRSLDLEISSKMASELAKHSQGDFRMVIRDAQRVERVMRASGLTAITEELVREMCR